MDDLTAEGSKYLMFLITFDLSKSNIIMPSISLLYTFDNTLDNTLVTSKPYL